jgi:hypothetical protein
MTDIKDMCNHYIENRDGNMFTTGQDYEEVRDICLAPSKYRVVVSIEEKIPPCADLVVDILVKHILDVIAGGDDDVEEMNAFYFYMHKIYQFDGEEHAYLLKATTEEALEYCVRWILNDCPAVLASGFLK